MICSSLIVSYLYICLVNAQNNEASNTDSQSAPDPTAAFSSVLENILNGEGNATSVLSSYSEHLSSVLESLSASEFPSDTVSTPAYGYGESTPVPTAYPHVYPTAVPSDLPDLPEIICSISCTVDEETSTSGETESVSKRSLNQNSTSNDGIDAEDSEDSEIALDRVIPGGFIQDGLDAPVLPDGDCGPRVRPVAPQTPWGWPSSWKSHRNRPYMCYYHAATLPECKNIHDQAVASYCVKSPSPRLCKTRACQVLDQCKSIIASGRGYCWNPKWFVA